MKRLTWTMALAVALLVPGCDDDGMGDTDAGPGGGMDAGPGGDTDAGPGGDTDAGPGGDTDAGPGGDTDAGPGGDTDAGPGGADGGGGGDVGIPCGMMTCDPATQRCCSGGGLGGARQMCIDTGMPCDGVTTACDGPEDCATGEVCCARRNGAGGGGGAMCVTAEMCMSSGFQQFELCHTMADCSTATDMCCPASFLPGVDGVCRMTCGFTP